MTENKSKTGTAEIIKNETGKRVLRLIQIYPDGSPKNFLDIPAEMPKVRKNNLIGQPRWKNGSLLTVDQKATENYETKNKIA